MRYVHSAALALVAIAITACPPTSSDANDLAALLLARMGPATQTAACPSKAIATGITLADRVTLAAANTGEGFTDQNKAINGVCGGGLGGGSTDVFSLDQTGAGAVIVLEWAGKKITNGAGIDFVVFENAFRKNGSASDLFLEPIIVEVSENATTYGANQWCGFAPDFTGTPETTHSTNPAHWLRFAGIAPILYNQDTNPLSATAVFDSAQAGGDGFDLSDLSDANSFGINCNTTIRNNIQANGFTYLRLVAASARTNADSASAFPKDAGAFSGPDIDGVVGRYLMNR